MNRLEKEKSEIISKAVTEALIKFSIIALIVVICWRTFLAFLPVLLWSLILAIALFPLRSTLERKLSLSIKMSSIIITIVLLFIIGTPTLMVGNSFATKVLDTYSAYQSNEIQIPAPDRKIKDWPLVGDKVYDGLVSAKTNLPKFINTHEEGFNKTLSFIVKKTKGIAGTIFLFLGAIIIAGIMLVWAERGEQVTKRIFIRLADKEKGLDLHHLVTSTIRQVGIGVIGVAFVTAVLFGLVTALAGLPAPALFTVAALFLAIAQLPVTLLAIVAVSILWSTPENSVFFNSAFSFLLVVASLIDNVLKPLVLGRGLSVPMPIVLIGALGGMASAGILGMFIGATFLCVGYQVFMKWIDTEEM
jgi:predicted PurR-regulated permease PerM